MSADPTATILDESPSERWLRRLLGSLSVVTLLMTVPQIWKIWIDHQAAGLSILSWSAYLVSALVWFWYGLRKRDLNIYLPCVGWIGMDVAIIAGAVVYG